MSMLRHALVLGTASLGVAAVIACSSSSTVGAPGSDSGPTPADPGAACDAIYDALNTLYGTCGLTLPADVVAADKTRFHDSCVTGLKYPGDGVTADTLNGCAAALKSSSCRGSNPASDSCAAKTGTLADGTACNSDSQCVSGYCKYAAPVSDGGATPDCGTCSPSVALGKACQTTDHCVIGSLCVGSTCVAFGTVDVGGDCAASGTADTRACKSGLVCNSQSKKCTALAGAGVACAASSDCQLGLACINKVCATELTAGMACAATATGDGCAPGLICDVLGTKKCTAITFGHPGDPCGFLANGVTACAQGTCNITDLKTFRGTCPQITPDGQPCTATDKTKTCDYGASCDLNTNVCTAAKPVCK